MNPYHQLQRQLQLLFKTNFVRSMGANPKTHVWIYYISLWAPQGCKMVGVGGNFGFYQNEVQNLRWILWTSMLKVIKTSRNTSSKTSSSSKT